MSNNGGNVAANIPQAATWDPDGANVAAPLDAERSGGSRRQYGDGLQHVEHDRIPFDGVCGPACRRSGQHVQPDRTSLLHRHRFANRVTTRWGDYSAMTLDPDGCTFWYTSEYANPADQTFDHRWLTKFGSINAFPGCTPVGAGGTVSGVVTQTPSGTPLSGATVMLGSRSTTTDASGSYSFAVPAGTYPGMTASFPGCTSATASNIAVTDGDTTPENFALAGASNGGCLADTTQSDFQSGVPTNVDLTSQSRRRDADESASQRSGEHGRHHHGHRFRYSRVYRSDIRCSAVRTAGQSRRPVVLQRLWRNTSEPHALRTQHERGFADGCRSRQCDHSRFGVRRAARAFCTPPVSPRLQQ